LEAAQLLGFDRSKEAEEALLAALAPETPPLVLRAVFDSLARLPAAATAGAVVGRWGEFSPPLKSEAARFLAAHPVRAKALLESLDRGKIHRDEIPSAQ